MLHELLTTPDVTLTVDDVLPTLYTFINRRYWSRLARRDHVDIAWDGSPMPDMPRDWFRGGDGRRGQSAEYQDVSGIERMVDPGGSPRGRETEWFSALIDCIGRPCSQMVWWVVPGGFGRHGTDARRFNASEIRLDLGKIGPYPFPEMTQAEPT